MTKDLQFYKELKELLKKYDAEIAIEDFGSGWSKDNKIVVDFNWKPDIEKDSTDQLVIGTWEDGAD